MYRDFAKSTIPDVVVGRKKDGVIIIEAIKADFISELNGVEPLANAYTQAIIDTCEKVAVEMLKSVGFVKQEWISVKERLPKIPDDTCVKCLVYNPEWEEKYNDGIMTLWYFKDSDAWDGVTHWMPLPDAPYAASQPEKE